MNLKNKDIKFDFSHWSAKFIA